MLAILGIDVAVAVLDGEQVCIIKGAQLLQDIRERGKPRERTKLWFISVRDVEEALAEGPNRSHQLMSADLPDALTLIEGARPSALGGGDVHEHHRTATLRLDET